ncbi:MAG TPA: acyl carrier protein [Puia sp.]|jgi:acyl carrier protein
MKNTILRPSHISEEEISFIIRDIIQYKLGVEEHKLHEDAHFQDDLGVDSLDLIELRMEIEKQFNVIITDEEVETLTTVGSTIACIKRKK